jgi:hypothetical protein
MPFGFAPPGRDIMASTDRTGRMMSLSWVVSRFMDFLLPLVTTLTTPQRTRGNLEVTAFYPNGQALNQSLSDLRAS